ncbi:MAG: hypothetical protein U9N79_02080 [Actinomycetota bacterium]|nr:hypothetical protein [Actinomycetota bacterium]
MRDAGPIIAIGIVLVPLVAMWIFSLFNIVVKRNDLSIGWKGIWSAIVILIPYIGVLVYAVVRPPAQAMGPDQNDSTATGQAMDRIRRVTAEHDSGSITDEEFAADKAAVFGIGNT